jgi:uncharacterized membrane protein YagU involved in acid resistance
MERTTTRTTAEWIEFLILGAVVGMIGGAAMAMFTMIASATYLGMGFFTPLYVISSPLLGQQAMMMAMKGGVFYFTAGPALLGLVIHMMWSALFGMIFGLIAYLLHLKGATAVVAGLVYGLLVMVFMSFVVLPLVHAPSLGQLMGWLSFSIGHLLFGMVVGLWPVLRPQDFTGQMRSQARQAA